MAKYRFDGNKNRKANTSSKASANEINNQTSPGASLLSGILAEMSPQTSIMKIMWNKNLNPTVMRIQVVT